MKRGTLVILSDIQWTFLHQRPQSLAIEMLKHYRHVVFAEPWHPSKKKRQAVPLPPGLTRVSLWHWPFNAKLPIVGRIFGPLSRVFHPITTRINRWILEDEVGIYPDTILCESIQFGSLTKGWPITNVVMDYVDLYTGFTDLPQWMTDSFYALAERADVRIATHPKLADEIIAHSVVGNAAEDKFFQAKYGRVGIYWGFIGDYMNWKEILFDCDEGRTMVLVGPVKGTEIPKHPRLIYLGEQPHDALPVLSRCANFGFIYWKKTPLTACVATVKRHEYIASGLPCVVSKWMHAEHNTAAPMRWEDRAVAILRLVEAHDRRFTSMDI